MVNWSDVAASPPNCVAQMPNPAFVAGTARVACGTALGLQLLIGLQPGVFGNTVLQQLAQLLGVDSSLPIVVTGHSLGACQTIAMSCYLAATQNIPAAQIIPCAFAAPTAGNLDFAVSVFNKFPVSMIWNCSLDVVPMAFGNMGTAKTFWPGTFANSSVAAPTFPTFVQSILGYMSTANLAYGYQQPQPTCAPNMSNGANLTGTVPSEATLQAFVTKMSSTLEWNSWEIQLMWQHFPPNYYQLLSAMPNMLACPLPSLAQ
jgi:hypothetical protein